ncbi:conserved hypothetical protein [Ricinus communis]|uniref:PUM-HD domain-containing protein n=1 Tax=Ricinus communis TaxID=3988 RepID=B9RI51_RICCO|nr:conserved hypothetical protein [Ricinus communis]|eukprot:XP_002513420.1 pumilio homolog 18 [Ricinus communis]
MEKENSNAAGDFETPKSNLFVDSAIDSLSFSVENLSLINGDGYSSIGSNNSLAFNGEFSASRTQETTPDIQETGLEMSRTPVLTPLYPDGIWAVNYSTVNAGIHLSSFHGYHDMNFQSNNYDGASPSAIQESNENSCMVSQDFIPSMQNQESFIMFASTQQGSKHLQDLLAYSNSDFASKLLETVTASVVEIPVINYLMVDQYGCHVCSKLIDSCNDKQLALILERITRNDEQFVQICCNINGSKMIKKLIKKVKRSCLICYMTVSLYKGFCQLAINQIGSYVVVFCMDCLDVKQSALLYEAAISHCLILATDATGCVSINNFIDRIQGSHRQTLLELISDNAVFLSQDPSGNHVVQKVLELENPIINAKIGAQLKGHYARLSFQKWGSHVVEKCLVSQPIVYVVQDLLTCGSSQLSQIARDQFGNYVIQKALKVTKKKNITLHLILLNSLKPNLNALQNGYGKKVYRLIMDGIPVDEQVNEG